MDIVENTLDNRLEELRGHLLETRTIEGYWRGHLSSSALSTATAVFALGMVNKNEYKSLIQQGLNWLCDNSNSDGGWGDTVLSGSNISTTMLCWSAFVMTDDPDNYKKILSDAEQWLKNQAGWLNPERLLDAVNKQYGKDMTFSSPIMTMCALAGRLDGSKNIWKLIKPLPFELAAVPQKFYKSIRLPVVSYALPALIAIGQLHFDRRKPLNPLTRMLRYLTRDRTYKILENIYPEDGGFLEAIPLTSFVVMALAAIGRKESVVVKKGIKFLLKTVREDGSWPIDTNLATWVTTLSINALALNSDFKNILSQENRKVLQKWLLSQQHRKIHPYTNAESGGWAWTNTPGAVPDADDTAGALLALRRLEMVDENVLDAVTAAINWLLGLQNMDGGIPTFCRGWNKLPFDRSTADITSHVIAAMDTWLDVLEVPMQESVNTALDRAIGYLTQIQKSNGTWVPLWFGNQLNTKNENPLYGTAKVLISLSNFSRSDSIFSGDVVCKAVEWLLSIQKEDGGWGVDASIQSSIEETALATDALASILNRSNSLPEEDLKSTMPVEQMHSQVIKGASWLLKRTEDIKKLTPSPIGLYFAKLWYYEELYPVIFTISALEKVKKLITFEKRKEQ
ncbi:MAG: prenyltransferase/squalene oxidase repeat-containing protein [Planctomycetota bacterium]|jgi:squalene-hopene/tetraprenyl-beta-curcumene cyclase